MPAYTLSKKKSATNEQKETGKKDRAYANTRQVQTDLSAYTPKNKTQKQTNKKKTGRRDSRYKDKKVRNHSSIQNKCRKNKHDGASDKKTGIGRQT